MSTRGLRLSPSSRKPVTALDALHPFPPRRPSSNRSTTCATVRTTQARARCAYLPGYRAPATRPRTARPSPPGFGTVSRRRRRSRDRPSRRAAAPGTPPPRTAPAAVAPRPPRPPSPDGTRRRRPPRSRTTHGRDPPRASDVQASFRVQGSRGPGPPPCSCSAPPECAQPVKPRTGVARLTYSFRSTTPTMRHQARRVDQLRVRVVFDQLDRHPTGSRTTVSRRARSRSGTRSKGDEITQSGSSNRAAVPAERQFQGPSLQSDGRPICSRASIRPIHTGLNLLNLGIRSWPQGQEPAASRRLDGEAVRWGSSAQP